MLRSVTENTSSRFLKINYAICLVLVIFQHYKQVCGLDYCLGTSLHATCSQNEVVIVQEALYGRMKTGKCIRPGSNNTGCHADVQRIADSKCSGRQSCEIRVSNPEMDKVMGCNIDFSRYLSATYTCQRVIGVDVAQCQGPKTIQTSFHSGFLASVTSNTTGCGLKEAPYKIEALPGQTLQLTLHDFFHVQPAERIAGYEIRNKEECGVQYGSVKDCENWVKICRGRKRESELLQTKGHQVQIVLDTKAVKQYSFLIHVKVLGCHDINAPDNAWLTRVDDEITVGCHSGRQTWHLKCNGNHWSGVIGNCSHGLSDNQKYAAVKGGKVSISHGLSIVIIVTVSIVLCGTIILLGLLYLKRSPGRHYSNTKLLGKLPASHGKDVYTYQQQGHKLRLATERPDRNRYMHISEHAPPPDVLSEETGEDKYQPQQQQQQQQPNIPDYCSNRLDGTATFMDEYLLNIHQHEQAVSLDMTGMSNKPQSAAPPVGTEVDQTGFRHHGKTDMRI